MKTTFITISIALMLSSCMTTEEKIAKAKYIKVAELRELGKGRYKPDLYIISQNRNAYQVRVEDYLRVKAGDSLMIYDDLPYSEILKIYK